MIDEIDLGVDNYRIVMRMERSGSGWYLHLCPLGDVQTINPCIKSWKRKPTHKAIYKAAWGFVNAALILETAGAMQYFLRTVDGGQRNVLFYLDDGVSANLEICGEDIC